MCSKVGEVETAVGVVLVLMGWTVRLAVYYVQRSFIIVSIRYGTGMASLRDVEIRHLLALQAVADERSFGRAASRLGFTQSAVSQQVAALERIVGEPVFDRPGGPRPVELTPAGRVLYDHASAILERLARADDDLARLRAGEAGRIVIGTFQSISVRVLPDLLALIRTERPGIDMRFVEEDENELLVARLVAGELDATFLVGPANDDRCESIRLFADPFVAISCHRPGSETDVRPISPAELAAEPMVGQQDNSCQAIIDEGLRVAGADPSYVFRSNDNAAVQAMVRAGMGRAVLPLLAVDLADPDVVVRPIEPPIPPRVIYMVLPVGRTRSPALQRFVELAREACGRFGAAAGDAAPGALAAG
jgi:DNA-binding transcriptional LysR family regulator